MSKTILRIEMNEGMASKEGKLHVALDIGLNYYSLRTMVVYFMKKDTFSSSVRQTRFDSIGLLLGGEKGSNKNVITK